MPPLETLHTGDPSGGVFYLRIVLSPEEASRLWIFLNILFFTGRSCQHLAQPRRWRTTPCRLSATAYSVCSQLPFISEAVPPSTNWGRAMTWWQGPTNTGDFTNVSKFVKNANYQAPQDLISSSYFMHPIRLKPPQFRLSSKNIKFHACVKQGARLPLRTFEFWDNMGGKQLSELKRWKTYPMSIFPFSVSFLFPSTR